MCIIKKIDRQKLVKYKNDILRLLAENYSINLGNHMNVTEVAEKKYEELIGFEADGSAILYGAFKDNVMLGFMWAYVRGVFGQDRIHLEHIIVDKTARRQGVGKKLLEKLNEEALEKKIDIIELFTTLNNKNAVSFYENNEYEKVRVLMEKRVK